MPDWLQESMVTEGTQTSLSLLAIRLALSFLMGCLVAAIYVASEHKPRRDTFPLVATLVLLAVLIAMVTLVIGNSVARAFSLLGALAIVRFRTIVDDTRDTAFVIFAVVVGMAAGAGLFIIPLIGIPMVGLAAFVLSLWGKRYAGTGGESTLTIRLGLGFDPDDLLQAVFDKHLDQSHLIATTTARQGSALELTYAVRLRHAHSAIPLVTELNQRDGIQEVDLRLR